MLRVAGRAAGGLTSLVALRVATHYFGPATWGQIVTAAAVVAIFTGVGELGTATITAREMARPNADVSRLLGVCIATRAALALAATPVMLGLAFVIYRDNPAVWESVLVLSPALVVGSMQSAVATVFVGMQRLGMAGLLDLVGSAIAMGIAISAVAVGWGRTGFLEATVGGAALSLGVAVVFAWRVSPVRPVVSVAASKALLGISLTLGAVQILNAFYFKLDTVLLSVLRPGAAVGFYGVAYVIVEFVMAIPSFFMLAVMPFAVRATPQQRDRMAQEAFDILMSGAAIVITTSVLLARPVMVFVSGSRFAPAASPFALLGTAAGLSFISALYGNLLVVVDAKSSMLRLAAITIAVNLAGNLVLIPLAGATGAAAALAITELVALVIITVVYHHQTGFRARYNQVPKALTASTAVIGVWATMNVTRWFASSPTAVVTVELPTLAVVYWLVLVLCGGSAPFAASRRWLSAGNPQLPEPTCGT
ncbi:MAG: oligosaccharide flippase family protein [Acidimicrobiales bacterium]